VDQELKVELDTANHPGMVAKTAKDLQKKQEIVMISHVLVSQYASNLYVIVKNAFET